VTLFCSECWAERPDGTPCPCGGDVVDEAPREGYDAIVDRLMASGYDREEAEMLANAGMSEEEAA